MSSRFGTKAFWATWRASFFAEPGSISAETPADGALSGVATEDIARASRRYIRELERRLHVASQHAEGTPVVVPHIDFDEPAGNPLAAVRKGYGLTPPRSQGRKA